MMAGIHLFWQMSRQAVSPANVHGMAGIEGTQARDLSASFTIAVVCAPPHPGMHGCFLAELAGRLKVMRGGGMVGQDRTVGQRLAGRASSRSKGLLVPISYPRCNHLTLATIDH